PHIVPNTGSTVETAIKWNIHKGMKPIKWLISPEVARAAELFPQYDTVKAIKAGVENWNEVFGFKAFEAAVAQPGESFGDDDKNFIIFDADPSFGAAFAQTRTNPTTGEIRGASVYFNAVWLYAGDQEFSDDPLAPAAARPVITLPSQRPRTTFQWGG